MPPCVFWDEKAGVLRIMAELENNKFKYLNRVAVIGAGTMGAQIACVFSSIGILVDLFDLPDLNNLKDPLNKIKSSLKNLEKLDPSPLSHPNTLLNITPRNLELESDLNLLNQADLVLEAIVEKLEIKIKLFEKIIPYLNLNTLLASNTSGLSINTMASYLPLEIQKRFCGIHFFNPPRYLNLVELIPSKNFDLNLLDQLESFLVRYLGKFIIRAKDTPNFIANRIGIFSLVSVMHYTEIFNLPIEIVDELTGKLLGRPKSATYRTADLVGLDIISHVLNTLKINLPTCPFKKLYDLPGWVLELINSGALGQKSGKGFYEKRVNKSEGIYVYDLKNKTYRSKNNSASKEILEIFEKKSWEERFKKIINLKNNKNPEAGFLWAIFRELFIYSAHVLKEISEDPRQIDWALRFGFGWKMGIFEIWELGRWDFIREEIAQDIKNKNALSNQELPAWVFESSFESLVKNQEKKENQDKNLLKIYERQSFSPRVNFGANFGVNFGVNNNSHIKILWENEAVSLWLDNKNQKNNIPVLSLKTKMGTISSKVLEGMHACLDLAEKDYEGLVIFQKDIEHFSAGADLMEAGEKFLMEGPEALNKYLDFFQKTCLKIRYSKIPVVSAVRGFAFGGGCEFVLHSDAVVAAQESYIGLVELGVGLIPGAGGSKELAYRASIAQDPYKAFQTNFKTIAMASVGKGAYWARDLGFLKDSDSIVANPYEILELARQKAQYLFNSNYRPMLPPKIQVQGREGRALVRMFLSNLRAGEEISEYDYFLADQLAYVMTGGDLDQGSWVDEAWLLKLERQVFLNLVEQEKTFERIDYLLKTGKPLRN